MGSFRRKWAFRAPHIAGLILACAVIYSCNQDEYYGMEETAEDAVLTQNEALVTARAMTFGNPAVDSVATSDELWEFKAASDELTQRYDSCVAALSEEELNELMEHLEDDEYMEAVFANVNVEKELERINRAQESLFLRTGFLKLTDEERALLYEMLAEATVTPSVTPLKTREESNAHIEECKKKKEEAYNIAITDYNTTYYNCNTNACRKLAAKKLAIAKQDADKAYLDCINNE